MKRFLQLTLLVAALIAALTSVSALKHKKERCVHLVNDGDADYVEGGLN